MFPLIAAAVTRLPQVLKAADTAANVLQGASAASDLAKLKPPKPLDPTDMVATAGGGDNKINY